MPTSLQLASKMNSNGSVATLVLLTAAAAFVGYVIARTINPTNADLVRTLIAKHPEKARVKFLAPATKEQLETADTEIGKRNSGKRLPESVKAIYSLCGGQPWGTDSDTELFPSFALTPIDHAIDNYKELCELYDSVIPNESDSFPNTWYDYRLFPFGWLPGTGTFYCVDIDSERIYSFHPDGGLIGLKYESISELLKASIEHQRSSDRTARK